MEGLRAQAYHMSRKHADAVNEYIDQLEVERKEANQFIIQIAELLGIDTDGIGHDGLQLSIDDFKEAINQLN